MTKATVKNAAIAGDRDGLVSRGVLPNALRTVGIKGRIRRKRPSKRTSSYRERDSSEDGTVAAIIPPSLRSSLNLSSPLSLCTFVASPSRCDSIVALDCEMVATRGGRSALAHCTILSYSGELLFHKYVRPTETIFDYRTRWSGVLPQHMKRAMPHRVAVATIKGLLRGKIVVGHDLSNDLAAIGATHPLNETRDTAYFKPLREMAGLARKQTPSLKNLCATLLGRKIQTCTGGHSSLEDARAALDLYCKYEAAWERYLVERNLDHTEWLRDEYWPPDIAVQS